MYAIMNMEDKGLIVQAEAGQRVKDPAAIGTGLHLLYKLLLLPKFEKGGRVQINAVSVKRKSRLFLYL